MSDSIWVEEAESSRRANCQSKMSISGHKADFKGFYEPSDLINRAVFSKITSALIRQPKFRDGGHMEEHHRIKSGTWMSHWGLHPASHMFSSLPMLLLLTWVQEKTSSGSRHKCLIILRGRWQIQQWSHTAAYTHRVVPKIYLTCLYNIFNFVYLPYLCEWIEHIILMVL